MFNVTVDLERGCFETEIFGFWSPETMTAFGLAVAEAATRIRATGRAPVSLCDYSRATIQSQEVVAAFGKMTRKPMVRSRRVAIYTDGALTKMRAARATRDHAEFRFFTDKDEARAWPFTEKDRAVA